jgi:hypothetical protein
MRTPRLAGRETLSPRADQVDPVNTVGWVGEGGVGQQATETCRARYIQLLPNMASIIAARLEPTYCGLVPRVESNVHVLSPSVYFLLNTNKKY